jgi:quinol monooxygenase YgiN
MRRPIRKTEAAMIHTVLQVKTSPATDAEARRLLRAVVGPCSAQRGCSGCRMLEDEEDPWGLWLFQEWDSLENLKDHFRSEAFRWLLAAMDLSVSSPDLRFLFVDRSCGIELVEEARAIDGSGGGAAKGPVAGRK